MHYLGIIYVRTSYNVHVYRTETAFLVNTSTHMYLLKPDMSLLEAIPRNMQRCDWLTWLIEQTSTSKMKQGLP